MDDGRTANQIRPSCTACGIRHVAYTSKMAEDKAERVILGRQNNLPLFDQKEAGLSDFQ